MPAAITKVANALLLTSMAASPENKLSHQLFLDNQPMSTSHFLDSSLHD
jgi:hypothetical protein